MKIARIFPTKTNMTPTDEHAYFSGPDMFTPKDYDIAYISVVFTWDKPKAEKLKYFKLIDEFLYKVKYYH